MLSKKYNLQILCLVFFLLTCGSDDHDPSDHDRLSDDYRQVRFQQNQSLSQFLEDIVEYYRIPGISAVLVSKYSVVQMGIAGVRRFGSPSEIIPDDIFCIGSCEKSMTAVLAASFVEEGLLSWKIQYPFRNLNERYLSCSIRLDRFH